MATQEPQYYAQPPPYGPAVPPPRRRGVSPLLIAATAAVCLVLVAAVAITAFVILRRDRTPLPANQRATVFVVRLCTVQSSNAACGHQRYTSAQALTISEALRDSAGIAYVTFEAADAEFVVHTVKPERLGTIQALLTGVSGVDAVATE